MNKTKNCHDYMACAHLPVGKSQRMKKTGEHSQIAEKIGKEVTK